jgi:hypothetical protein
MHSSKWLCASICLDFLCTIYQITTSCNYFNPEKTKYMSASRSQKTGQKHSIKIANMSFEEMTKFKYLGTTLSD